MNRSEQESYAASKQRMIELEDRKHRIRSLNDQLRKLQTGGRTMITSGVRALGDDTLRRLLNLIASFDQFAEDNDPYDEHDFGSVEIDGERIFWKIDCYDRKFEYGSPDPADPSLTQRVLTIMLASEY